MTTAAVRGVVRYIGGGPADPPTDAHLVNEFAATRSEPAFAELLRRHGPVVLGACRRILSDAHAAEDAFQAVFLVLARKARSIRPPGLVGSWLYGVAVRTAKKAKVAEARRWRREMRHVMASAERGRPELCTAQHAELRAAIDDELAKLPARLRAAVVLCDLGGKSRAEAARELGCPEGTLASRLAKARRTLADRLTRRGVAVPAAGVSTLLAPALAAAVPPALAANTLAAALGTAAASAPAVHLAEGVVRTMTANKLKLWAAPLLLLAAAAGGTVLSRETPSPEPAPPPPPAAAAAKEPDVRWKEVKTLETAGWLAGAVAYSPDGKTLVAGGTGRVRAYDAATFKELWTSDVDAAGQHFAAVAFSADGRSLAATYQDGVKFLDAADGKVGDALEEKGSKPTVVGWYADSPVAGQPELQSRKVVFNGEKGYHIKTWIAWPQVSSIDLPVQNAGTPRRAAGEVPLAVHPKGLYSVQTGPLDRATGKNILWAYSAGRGASGERMTGHEATVTSAAWSADGTTIVTGDTGGTVIVWDAATFKEKSRVAFARKRITCVAVTADGRTAAAGTVGGGVAVGPPSRAIYTEEVFVWPTANPPRDPKPIALPREGGGEQFDGVAGLAFSPDGKSLAAASANFKHLAFLGRLVGQVRVWSVEEPKAEPNPAPATWVSGVTYSPDGKRFAVSPGGSVRDPSGKELYAVGGEACGFSADGKTLFVMEAKAVTFHDAETGRELKSHPRPKTNLGWHLVAFSPDGSRYAAHFGFGVRVFDTATGFEPVRLENQHEPGSTIVAQTGKQVLFSPDGKRVAVVGVLVGGGVMGAAVWDTETGNRVYHTDNFLAGPRSVAWSADGKQFAVGFAQRAVVYDAATFKELRQIPQTGGVSVVAFTPSGNVALGGENRLADGRDPPTFVRRVWVHIDDPKRDYGGAAVIDRDAEVGKTTAPLTALAFAPDGNSLVTGTGVLPVSPVPVGEEKVPGGVKVWWLDAAGKGQSAAAIAVWQPHYEAAILTQHLGPVDSAAWSPDGKAFASGGFDGKVLIWDAATRKPLQLGSVLPAGKRTAVAFSPDGTQVAATRDRVTGLFDVAKRQVVLKNPPLPGGRAVAFSPDGKWLGVHDGTRLALRGRAAGLADTEIPSAIDVPLGDSPALMAWSPDEARVAIPHPQQVEGGFGVAVHPVGEGKTARLMGHETKVCSIAWSADGKRIATGDANGMLFIWDAAAMKELTRLRIAGRNGSSAIHALAFAPDGVTLAVGVELDAGKGVHRVILFDAATGKQGDFLTVGERLRSVAFSPNGMALLVAYGADRDQLKPLMTPAEIADAGGIAVWERAK